MHANICRGHPRGIWCSLCTLWYSQEWGISQIYPLENKKNERMNIDNEDDGMWRGRAGGSGRKVCVPVWERVCLLLSHEKANPSMYYNTGWSIMLSEMRQSKINAVRLHWAHWRTNQKWLNPQMQMVNAIPRSKGTGNSVDTELPSGKMKTNALSLLPAYSPVVLCCTLKMCKGRLVVWF